MKKLYLMVLSTFLNGKGVNTLMIFTLLQKKSCQCLQKTLSLMIIITLTVMLSGCDKEVTYESFDHQARTMDARIFGDTVLDTTTMEEDDRDAIINAVNLYFESAEYMTNVERKEDVAGGRQSFHLVTEEDREILIHDAYVKMNGDTERAGGIVIDGEEIGFFDANTYDGFKESFDLESYAPES